MNRTTSFVEAALDRVGSGLLLALGLAAAAAVAAIGAGV